jgi:hypothetical protein
MASNVPSNLDEERWSESEVLRLRLLGIVNRVTLHRKRRAGLIGFYKIGNRVFYGRHHIEEFLAKCEKKAKKGEF